MLRPGETSVNPNLSAAAGVSRAGELTRLRTGFGRTDREPAPPFASPSRRSRAQSRRMRARAPLQSQRMRARKALRSRAGAPMIASHYTYILERGIDPAIARFYGVGAYTAD